MFLPIRNIFAARGLFPRKRMAKTNRAVNAVRPQPIGTRLVEALFQDELLQLHRAFLLAHFATRGRGGLR